MKQIGGGIWGVNSSSCSSDEGRPFCIVLKLPSAALLRMSAQAPPCFKQVVKQMYSIYQHETLSCLVLKDFRALRLAALDLSGSCEERERPCLDMHGAETIFGALTR